MQLRLIIHLFFIASLALFSQCTIQKRVYQKGWYVDIHRSLKQQHPVSDDQPVASNEATPQLKLQDLIDHSSHEKLPEVNEEIALIERDSVVEIYPAKQLERRTESVLDLPKEVRQSKKDINESIQQKPNSEKEHWTLTMKTLIIFAFLSVVVVGAILLFLGALTITTIAETILAYIGIFLILILALIILFVMLAMPSQEAVDRGAERKKQRAIDQKINKKLKKQSKND